MMQVVACSSLLHVSQRDDRLSDGFGEVWCFSLPYAKHADKLDSTDN